MSDIPLRKLRRNKSHRAPEQPGIALTPDSINMSAPAVIAARRNRRGYQRYVDDAEEEQGLLEAEDYDGPPETVRVLIIMTSEFIIMICA